MDENDPIEQGGEQVTEEPNLGAVADDLLSDTLDDAQKNEALAEAKAPANRDPTEGMSDGQRVDYWANRAGNFESALKEERHKRQEYTKKYGGLNGANAQEKTARPDYNFGKSPRSLDDVQDLGSYTRYILEEASKQFERKMSDQQLDSRVEYTETRARDLHNGEDGLPAYDELVDEFVVPMIQKNPRIFEVIKQLPDPAEASYTLGFLMKYPKFSEMIKSQSRDDLVKNINATARQAATVRGRSNGHQPTGKLSKAEIDAMNPEEFEKVLEQFRAGE